MRQLVKQLLKFFSEHPGYDMDTSPKIVRPKELELEAA